jgi:peptidyl-tRNA hydrolase, PTH1 family
VAGDVLIVGLGNPGPRFHATRHNVGFDLVEALSLFLGWRLRKPLFRPLRWGPPSVSPGVGLAMPLTYMNRSGEVLPWLLRRTRVPLDRLIIAVDNMDLPPGEVRMKRRGGSAGHNGLKSVGAALAGDDYPRLYIGVGRPPSGESTVEHVLGSFDREDRRRVDAAIERILPVLADAATLETEQLISAVNARRRE